MISVHPLFSLNIRAACCPIYQFTTLTGRTAVRLLAVVSVAIVTAGAGGVSRLAINEVGIAADKLDERPPPHYAPGSEQGIVPAQASVPEGVMSALGQKADICGAHVRGHRANAAV